MQDSQNDIQEEISEDTPFSLADNKDHTAVWRRLLKILKKIDPKTKVETGDFWENETLAMAIRELAFQQINAKRGDKFGLGGSSSKQFANDNEKSLYLRTNVRAAGAHLDDAALSEVVLGLGYNLDLSTEQMPRVLEANSSNGNSIKLINNSGNAEAARALNAGDFSQAAHGDHWKLESEDNRGGGDCGPLAIAQAITNHYIESENMRQELYRVASLEAAKPTPPPMSAVTHSINEYLKTENTAPTEDAVFGGSDAVESKLYKKIMDLKCRKANLSGIKTTIVKNERAGYGEAQYTLIRDARSMRQDSNEEVLGAHNYAQIGVSYCIAMKTIFLSENLLAKCLTAKEEAPYDASSLNAKLLELSEDFCGRMLRLKTSTEQEACLNSFVINTLAPILSEASGQTIDCGKAIKMLDKTKNWVALYQPTLAVATIDTVRNDKTNAAQDLVRYEEPLTALSPDMAEEIRNRKSKLWYQCQTKSAKNLIDHFAPMILNGHQIPSQLRVHLPGLKNSYRSTTAAVSERSRLLSLTSSNHCASVVPVIKVDPEHSRKIPKAELEKAMDMERLRLTKLTMEQQQCVTRSGSSTMVALNSEKADVVQRRLLKVKKVFNKKYRGQVYEALDREMALKTMESKHGTCGAAKICLNGFAMLEKNKDQDVKAFAKKAAQLADQTKDLKTISPKLLLALKASAKRLTKRTKTSWFTRLFTFNKKSTGVKVVQEFTHLSHLYNAVLQQLPPDSPVLQDFKLHEVFYACASGENRTGIVEVASQFRGVQYELERLTGTTLESKDVIRQFARSGHTQFITGSQGGIMGAETIRGKSAGSLTPKLKAVKKLIVRPYSDFKAVNTKKLPKKKAAQKAAQKQLKRHHKAAPRSRQSAKIHPEFDKVEIEQDLTTIKCLLQDVIRERIVCLTSPHQNELILALRGAEAMATRLQSLLKTNPASAKIQLQRLAKSYAEVHFSAMLYSAQAEQHLPCNLNELAKAIGELCNAPDLVEVAEFTYKDLADIRRTVKIDRATKIGLAAGFAVGAVACPAVAVLGVKGKTFAALATLAGHSLKAKLSIDAASAAVGGAIARFSGRKRSSRGMFSASSDNADLNRCISNADASGKDVSGIVEKLAAPIRKALSTFRKLLGIQDSNSIKPVQFELADSAIDHIQAADSSGVSSHPSRLPKHYTVFDFDLTTYKHKSRLSPTTVVDTPFGNESNDDEHNSVASQRTIENDPADNKVSLAFAKDNLQQVYVSHHGEHSPAEKIVHLLHSQGKKTIKLEGNLAPEFVKEVYDTCESFKPPITVIDNRINKAVTLDGVLDNFEHDIGEQSLSAG